MRVNVYAEEMTNRVELVHKEVGGEVFTGVRFYLALPVTTPDGMQISGPFMHHREDDDSAAVTFWGKQELRKALEKALDLLNSSTSAIKV
jgi:hypothetical protein